MITLKRLKLQGFFGIAEAEISLENQGLVLITGTNGAGKTALVIESLLCALYGQSFEYGAAPGDKVVNWRTGYCLVELDFSIGDVNYTVRRSRSHPDYGSAVTLLVNGVDKSLGSAASTQASLEVALGGMDAEAFKSSVVFSTDLVRFPSFPDKAKKAVIENLLGINESDAALEKAKAGRSIAVQGEEVVKRELANVESNISQHEASLRSLTSHTEEFTVADTKRLLALPDEIDALSKAAEAAAMETPVAEDEDNSDTTRIAAAIEQAAADAAKFKDEWNAARDAKQEELAPLEKELTECKLKLQTCNTNLRTLHRELAEKECPACRRSWGEEHKAPIKEKVAKYEEGARIMDEAIAEIIAEKDKIEAKFAEQETKARQAMDAAKRTGETLTKQLHSLKAAQAAKVKAALEAVQSKRSRLARELRDLQGELSSLQSRKSRVEGAKEANEAAAARVTDALKECTAQRAELASRLEGLSKECEKWQMLVECFSPKGARMLVLQSAVPRLNSLARRIAPILAPGISVSFEARESEAFAVLVNNANGAKQYRGNSAGERRKVDLVVLFCLAGLQQHPINLLSIDEAFEKLAPDAQDSVAAFLKTQLKPGGLSTIFMINHTADTVSQYADQVWNMNSGVLSQ